MNWSYIAGFFDGEGNINANKGIKSTIIQIRLYNTNGCVLEEMKDFMNMGSIYQDNKTKVYELTIYNKPESLFFLKAILHFLQIKRKIAYYVLDNYCFRRGDSNMSFDVVAFNELKKEERLDLPNNYYFFPNNSGIKESLHRITYKGEMRLPNNSRSKPNNLSYRINGHFITRE